MKILFVGIGTGAFYPNGHRIRAVFPLDTAFRSGRGTVEVQALEVLPGHTQRHITRARSTEVQFRNTDSSIGHKGAVARAALLLVHKREFGTNLTHVRTMPVFQLYITLKLLRPVLKMRVGQLLRTHRRHGE